MTGEGRSIEWRHVALLTLTGFLLVFAAFEVYVAFQMRNWYAGIGGDRTIYVDAAQRWLGGGSFYLPHQLHGVYPIEVGDVLYPPTALWFLVPASFLPPLLWWAIPVGLIAWLVYRWHPSMGWWPVIAAGIAYPETLALIRAANPGLWIVAAFAAGLPWRWPSALVLLKPSLLPFAFVGCRSRSWWVTIGLMAVLTVPLLPLLPDWVHAVVDGRGSGGLLYSLHEIPLLCIPLAAWLGRHKGSASPECDDR